MHEQIIVSKILAEAEKLGNISELQLEVGELSDITGEELKDSLENMTRLKLKISSKISKVKCSCGYTGRAKILERGHDFCLYVCPKCRNKKPKVLEGGAIKIIGAK